MLGKRKIQYREVDRYVKNYLEHLLDEAICSFTKSSTILWRIIVR